MVNANSPRFQSRMDEVQAAASTLDLEATILEIRRVEDVAPAFEAIKERADAIATRALAARIPTIFEVRDFVDAGGLMSYGANVTELLRLAANFVDRILRGAPTYRSNSQPSSISSSI